MDVFLSFTVVGLVYGCLYALAASGLVVTYRTSGIFNFAHGAIGMFMAFVYWQLAVAWHVPALVAMLAVLAVVAPLSGAMIERVVIRKLYGAPLGVTLVVTLGLLLVLLGIADGIWKANTTRNLPSLVGTGELHIFGVAVTDYNIVVLAVSIAVAAGLPLLFSRTRVGIAMRAVVDDRDLTARVGASPARTAQLSWAIGASLAALAGILIAKLEYLDQLNLTLLVITGFAAAVVGRLKSLPLTIVGAVILGLMQSYATAYLPPTLLSNLNPVIPMILLFLALLVLKQDRLQGAKIITKRTAPTMRLWPSVWMGGAFVGITVVMTTVLSAGNLIYYGVGVVLGIVMLSLVLLSGYGGQVSLCQMTMAGFGAFFMGKTLGGHSIIGLVASAVAPAAIGAVLALIVIRLRGLYLALATISFAYAMDSLFFGKFLGYGGNLPVGRVGFQSQKGFVIEASVIFAVISVAVLALKRGPFGRRLAALNDSEAASASIGLNLTLTKVTVFSIAAGIAGLGGALIGGWQQQISTSDVYWLQNLIVLLLITVFGLRTVTGAFAAAMFHALMPIVQTHVPSIPNLEFVLVGLGAILLGRFPSGVAGLAADLSDWLRAAIPNHRGVALGPERIQEGSLAVE